MSEAGVESSVLFEDQLHRFHLDAAAVRGVVVRLGAAWREIAAQSDYPAPIRTYLAQCLAAAALFAGSIRFAARVAIQLRGAGALRMVLAECGSDGALRGVARWDQDRPAPRSLAEFGAGALLSITTDEGDHAPRRQGLVPLTGADLSEAFEHYFAQSEQLPTRVYVVADRDQCAGILVQQLARQGGHALRHETDDFERASALVATLTETELLRLPVAQLLRRLFVEDDIRLHRPALLRFDCSCSQQRVESMLQSLGREEFLAAAAATGTVEVHCEFCHRRYEVGCEALQRLFGAAPP
jgi:molecular chaperone Hsp33